LREGFDVNFREAKKSSGELWGVSTSGGIHVILADNRDLANSILYTLVSCKGPISGQILLDEGLRPKDWIRHIGVIPSKDNLAGKLTIREHLLRAIRLRSWRGTSKEVRRERVNELLILFELDGIQNRRILRFDSKDAVGLLQRRLLMFGILFERRLLMAL
jgi:ABC-type Na+ transport system ATPase subunit NatA